jgi:hypothetical protein
MNTLKSIKTLAAVAIATAAMTFTTVATDNRAPEVPHQLSDPLVGQKVHFHANAIGVQIYRWTGTAWSFVGPVAVLYDNDGKVVGTHFATPNGPAWQSNSGSFFVGKRIDGVMVAPDAIPWLVLGQVSTGGHGVLNGTTFVQRVDTVGGLAPSTPGSTIGEQVEISYEAEYYFYRQEN